MLAAGRALMLAGGAGMTAYTFWEGSAAEAALTAVLALAVGLLPVGVLARKRSRSQGRRGRLALLFPFVLCGLALANQAIWNIRDGHAALAMTTLSALTAVIGCGLAARGAERLRNGQPPHPRSAGVR